VVLVMNDSILGMKYRKFGNLGWDVSEIGFGAWAIGGSWGAQGDPDSMAALHRAVDSGVNFIDTAEGYGNGHSEQLIGQLLKSRSEEIYVATKTPPMSGPWPPSPYCRWEDRYSEAYLRQNVEERLRTLNVEAIDLLQLHTWTRAWNSDPKPLEILQQMKQEGKIRAVGISTPEHDQNSAIDLMRMGIIDSLQVIYNIFEQEPAAELLPVAEENGVGIIVRVAFDEGVLTGKYAADHQFPEGDFRNDYFAGDRLARAVKRVESIQSSTGLAATDMPAAALGFALGHSAVGTVIAGTRNAEQAAANAAVSDQPAMDQAMLQKLHPHNWRRAFWYGGK
jgi:aryl-alcohol dehydrogenase-like predicted oxidoreductase